MRDPYILQFTSRRRINPNPTAHSRDFQRVSGAVLDRMSSPELITLCIAFAISSLVQTGGLHTVARPSEKKLCLKTRLCGIGKHARGCATILASTRQELLAKGARPVPLNPFEPAIEVGVVSKSNLEANIENAEVCIG